MDHYVSNIRETLTKYVVEDDLEPVERGRVSYVLYMVFYKLWRLLYFVTRLSMTYFVVLSSVLLTIAILNGLVGFLFHFYLPWSLGLSNPFMVSTTIILLSMILVTPCVAFIWMAFHMIPEVWSAEELPRSRIMVRYISAGLKGVAEHQLSAKISLILQFLKLVTFVIVLIVSLEVSDGSTYGIIEIFVLGGCGIGIVLFVFWVPLLIVTELAKFFKRDLVFPDSRVYRSLEDANPNKDGSDRGNGKTFGVVIVSVVMTLHGLVAIIIISLTLQAIGNDAATIGGSLCAVFFGMIFTYWVFFSSDSLSPEVIPSPNDDPEIIIKVEKNFKLLRIEPIPPRKLVVNIGLIILTGAFAVALLVLSTSFIDSVKMDTCAKASTQGMNITKFPQGTRSRDDYSRGLKSSVCHQRWHSSRLSALDMAFLAQVAYEDNANKRTGNCANVSAVKWLNQVYRFVHINGVPAADWEVRSHYKPELVARYYELHSPARNLTVFVVRGERGDRLADILELVDMYAPAGAFQFFSAFIPLSLSLPASKVSNLLYYVSFTDRLLKRPLPTYYQVVARAVEVALARSKDHPWYIGDRDNVFVVGHSLGGAVAKVAASFDSVNVTSVSFNGPGLLFSARSFGINAAVLETNTNNIVVTNDRFALLLDELGGTTFRLDCMTEQLGYCRSMGAIICRLFQLCGFPDYNYSCHV